MPIWILWAGRVLLIGGGLAFLGGIFQGTKEGTKNLSDWVLPIAIGVGVFILLDKTIKK